jgi:hypothetical protein
MSKQQDPTVALSFIATECLRMAGSVLEILDGAVNVVEAMIPGEGDLNRRMTINTFANNMKAMMPAWEHQLAALAIGEQMARQDAEIDAAAKRYAEEQCEGRGRG